MHPRPLEYTRADSVAEALEALGADAEAKVLAGGQSLVPMLSLGLASPTLLVDIGALELAGLERRNGAVRVGALTRHRELERSAEVAALLPLAAAAARHIGNARVRNRGTFGGSLSHADPAAELGAVALAHGGTALIEGPAGAREVDLGAFFAGFFETAVGGDELLVAAELELPPEGSGTGFVEVAQRADDFAVAAAAAIVTPDASGRAVGSVRLALAGVGEAPIRCPQAEASCVGLAGDGELLRAVGEAVASSISPETDAFVSADYRRRVAAVCAGRAVLAALDDAKGRKA